MGLLSLSSLGSATLDKAYLELLTLRRVVRVRGRTGSRLPDFQFPVLRCCGGGRDEVLGSKLTPVFSGET